MFPIDPADVAPGREVFRTPLRRCHDWRTYVPDNVAGAWHAFSTEDR